MSTFSSSESSLQSSQARQSILLADYIKGAEATDRFSSTEIRPILLGLYGEIGSVMAAVKKHKREQAAFIGYRQAVEEEFGDALWYFTAVCRRLGWSVDAVFSETTRNGKYASAIAASDLPVGTVSQISSVTSMPQLDEVLLSL